MVTILWLLTLLAYWLIIMIPFILLMRFLHKGKERAEQAYQEVQAKRRQLFLSRPVLSIDEWYRAHFAGTAIPQQVAMEVCTSLARALGCDATQIWPTDRFDREFRWPGEGPMANQDDAEMDQFTEGDLWHLLGKTRYKQLAVKSPTLFSLGDLLLEYNRLMQDASVEKG